MAVAAADGRTGLPQAQGWAQAQAQAQAEAQTEVEAQLEVEARTVATLAEDESRAILLASLAMMMAAAEPIIPAETCPVATQQGAAALEC